MAIDVKNFKYSDDYDDINVVRMQIPGMDDYVKAFQIAPKIYVMPEPHHNIITNTVQEWEDYRESNYKEDSQKDRFIQAIISHMKNIVTGKKGELLITQIGKLSPLLDLGDQIRREGIDLEGHKAEVNMRGLIQVAINRFHADEGFYRIKIIRGMAESTVKRGHVLIMAESPSVAHDNISGYAYCKFQ
ncbi:hypothetical protein IQ37_18735 [Chryseobacterium piperi]|uniref:Botulinum/Tetanus toxin catalytic chain domain-containing protein n=1 Tax=Chryseobacterium piperi TaxID=558152 RepID=A0A086AF46_9FLAO|nr:tetanus/botulinum neurotoxin [Chryseobacterium piperi]ASW73937.1 hypothetical protein CJF12_06295 [Chryseobacterium piperi]KFF15310.1 hypothetical protein IQ37_18735 [Chryseobacterium piperi]